MTGTNFIHFTEKNKENFIRIAENLLKVQKEDKAIVAGERTVIVTDTIFS